MSFAAGFGAIAASTLLTACSGTPASTPPPTTVPPATSAPATVPTSAAAAKPVASPSPSATQSPAAVPSPSAAMSPSPVASAAAPGATSGNTVRLVLDASASQASYHAREQLASKTLPSDAVGTGPVSGSLALGPNGSVAADQSTLTVDLTQLKSDDSRRDNYIMNNTLETSRYPTATFVARSVQGLPTSLPTSGSATFQLLGDLTVHGMTKPVTWDVSAQFASTTVSGSATTSVNLSDFGMTPPKVGPVLNVEDAMTLELAFTANRAA